jgi:hypothetical protein
LVLSLNPSEDYDGLKSSLRRRATRLPHINTHPIQLVVLRAFCWEIKVSYEAICPSNTFKLTEVLKCDLRGWLGYFGLDNPHYNEAPDLPTQANSSTQGMTNLIRSSTVLSFTRAASRKGLHTGLPSPVPFSTALFQTIRQMSSETNKHHFMVYAPDHTDPEAFQRRLGARPEHLQRIATLRSSGILSMCCPPVVESGR